MSIETPRTSHTVPVAPIVHVVDDDASLRDALVRLFRSVDLEVRAYASVQSFLDQLSDRPGCIVLDVRLPGTSGLDFQVRLNELGIRLPAVMMTGYGDIPMSVQAMKAGAVDFLAKPFRDQDMLDAVMAALALDRGRREAEGIAARARARFASLSAREVQVAILVAKGCMNKQVAAELGLSEITVKIHRGAAMRKLGASSLAELVRMVEAMKTS
jgi:FixJ family two-component response regulator